MRGVTDIQRVARSGGKGSVEPFQYLEEKHVWHVRM